MRAKLSHFGCEKRDTVIILVQDFANMFFVTKQVENTAAVFAFSISKKAQLQAIRITEQPILQTKSNISCPGYKFLKYFC